MRICIQRVKQASVKVANVFVGSIEKGALVFLGVHHNDTLQDMQYLVNKLVNLRMFTDDQDKMNFSLKDVGGEVLVVSQFTLYANCHTGRRPSFTDSASPTIAEELYLQFVEELKAHVSNVETGIFGALMEVSLINDGPVTFLIDAPDYSSRFS